MIILTYDSTHYYLVPCKGGWLMVDCGMPGTLPKLIAQLKKYRLSLADIRYVLPTHHHPDHAGIAQEIKNAGSAHLLIHEKQVPYLQKLHAYVEKKGNYVPVQVESSDLVVKTPNRPALAAIGVQGEIVETPGHSPDSVSLALDAAEAFIGDLNPLYPSEGEDPAVMVASWLKLFDMGIETFYPAHTNPLPASQAKGLLGLYPQAD